VAAPLSASPDDIEALLQFAHDLCFEVDDDVREKVARRIKEAGIALRASRAVDADVDVPGFTANCFLQARAVAYALRARRVLIATMGLGKTVEALATIAGAHAFPQLVVCRRVSSSTGTEAGRWLPDRRS